MDKSAPKNGTPKGAAYCEKPGTSCYYNSQDICVNCNRPKGWRLSKNNRVKLDRLAGR